MNMTPTKQQPNKKMVSYQDQEIERLSLMEGSLMDHYGYNYSQLNKDLVKVKYYALKAVLRKPKQAPQEKRLIISTIN